MRILPWVVSALVVFLLLRRYSLGAIVDQFRAGTSPMLFVWAGLATIPSLFVMTSADWLIFRASLDSITWPRVLRGRGAMSLIAALSYGAGQGSYGVWLSRTTGTPVGKTLGLLAYISLSDLSAVSILAAVALSISGMPLAPDFEWLVVVLAPAIAGTLLVAGLLGSRLLPRIFSGERVAGLVSPWSSVPPAIYLLSLAARVFNLLVLMTVSWAAAQSFGLDVPLAAFLSYLPLVYLVASLPINVGPLGAVQFAWLHFFGPYGTDEQILAFQILFSSLLTLFSYMGIGRPARGD
jgi:hypothetical protein